VADWEFDNFVMTFELSLVSEIHGQELDTLRKKTLSPTGSRTPRARDLWLRTDDDRRPPGGVRGRALGLAVVEKMFRQAATPSLQGLHRAVKIPEEAQSRHLGAHASNVIAHKGTSHTGSATCRCATTRRRVVFDNERQRVNKPGIARATRFREV